MHDSRARRRFKAEAVTSFRVDESFFFSSTRAAVSPFELASGRRAKYVASRKRNFSPVYSQWLKETRGCLNRALILHSPSTMFRTFPTPFTFSFRLPFDPVFYDWRWRNGVIYFTGKYSCCRHVNDGGSVEEPKCIIRRCILPWLLNVHNDVLKCTDLCFTLYYTRLMMQWCRWRVLFAVWLRSLDRVLLWSVWYSIVLFDLVCDVFG